MATAMNCGKKHQVKPTALIIAPDYPYPPSEGGLLRVYHLIASLGDTYTVDLLTLSGPTSSTPFGYPPLDRWCQRIDVIPAIFPKKDLWTQFRRIAYCVRHRLSPRSDVYVNDNIMRQVVTILAGRSYDLAILEHSWIANYYPLVQNALSASGITILDLHNIESDLKNEFATHSDNFPRSWVNHMFSRFSIQQERRWLPMFDHLFTTSDKDKQRIKTILYESEQAPLNSRISVIPNSIDIEFYKSVRQRSEQRKLLLFCGGLDFPPNRTAVELLVHHIFPQVRTTHKDCELMIVGKDDHHWIKPQSDGVTFTGFIDDIRPYINDASMILAPILNGSGTRFKVLEAWAARRPLIATAKAVEGLNATAMTHFWLANTTSDFVEGINQILFAPEQTYQMVDAAYRFVNEHYNARIIGEKVRKTLAALSHKPEHHTPSI